MGKTKSVYQNSKYRSQRTNLNKPEIMSSWDFLNKILMIPGLIEDFFLSIYQF